MGFASKGHLAPKELNLASKVGRAAHVPLCARPHGTTRVRAGVPRGAFCPRRAPVANRRECPCGIFLSGLVFENVRQRVGCKRLLNLKGVMSIAVECERFTLTAERLRNPILYLYKYRSKPLLAHGEDYPRG